MSLRQAFGRALEIAGAAMTQARGGSVAPVASATPGGLRSVGRYTIQALLQIAASSEQRYRALTAFYPINTYHAERNAVHLVAQQALVCAAWMEKSGITEVAYVGPFGVLPFSNGSRVRVREGAVIHTTGRGCGSPNTSTQCATAAAAVVTLHDVQDGGVVFDGQKHVVRQPLVRWAYGADSCRSADANDVVAA